MKLLRFMFTFLAIALHSALCYGQQENNINFNHCILKNTDSGYFLIENQIVKCQQKNYKATYYSNNTFGTREIALTMVPQKSKESFLKIHGNITYMFNYRSYIDTPFAESNVMQHTIQTRFDVQLKEKYPITVFLTSRNSNSDYFSNATDVSVQFKQSQMLESIKNNYRIQIENVLYNKSLATTPSQLYQLEKEGSIKDIGNFRSSNVKEKLSKKVEQKQMEIQENFSKLYKEYKTKLDKLEKLKSITKGTSSLQEKVEEKENKLRASNRKLTDSLKITQTALINNTIGKFNEQKENVQKKIESKEKQFESLQKEVTTAETDLKNYQKKITDSLQMLKKMLSKIKDQNSLNNYLYETEGTISSLPKLQRLLLSIKQIGIGRSWIDYSELTVKNISLSGFNIETNPNNLYFAVAAGKVNYRFRDYILKSNYASSNQNVALIRAGYGQKDKNNLIITYYNGQKTVLTQTNNATHNTQHISGFSLETRKKIDEHNWIIAEYARSTTSNITNKLFDFSDNANEAFSIKLNSDYKNTRVNGWYRKTGENFQSFTLFPTNSKQDSWMLRINQTIWKKRLLLDASIRKNDFTSLIALPNFANKNVFKAIQITARIPKYPFVSLGYYPSSQLTLSDNNVLYENRYNTFNSVISHSYYFKKISMNSNATFTKFFNSGIDTSFIYFNASTFTLNHSLIFQKFITQGIVTVTNQSLIKQITIEPIITYKLKDILSLSTSVKWNRINKAETLWGGTGGLNMYIKKIGILQMQYEKIYLPSYSRKLLPVDMGRLIFTKIF